MALMSQPVACSPYRSLTYFWRPLIEQLSFQTFFKGVNAVCGDEVNLGRMKDGEAIRRKITQPAFISARHSHHHQPPPPFSDQIKLKPDGARPGLCVVSDCHGALTMISH